ncbi:MAG: hypothetical protein K5656_00420 [Lachnospiraceae bacterium]|nr:hypothetical protein [Lachnospiraceae bacterium]
MKSVFVELYKGYEIKWLIRLILIVATNYILFCANSDVSTDYYHLFWSNAIICWWVMLIFFSNIIGSASISPAYKLYKGNIEIANRLYKRAIILTVIYTLIMIISAGINTLIGVFAFHKKFFYGRLDIQTMAFIAFVISLYIMQMLDIIRQVKGKKVNRFYHYIPLALIYIITFLAEINTINYEGKGLITSPRDLIIGALVIIIFFLYSIVIKKYFINKLSEI